MRKRVIPPMDKLVVLDATNLLTAMKIHITNWVIEANIGIDTNKISNMNILENILTYQFNHILSTEYGIIIAPYTHTIDRSLSELTRSLYTRNHELLYSMVSNIVPTINNVNLTNKINVVVFNTSIHVYIRNV